MIVKYLFVILFYTVYTDRAGEYNMPYEEGCIEIQLQRIQDILQHHYFKGTFINMNM